MCNCEDCFYYELEKSKYRVICSDDEMERWNTKTLTDLDKVKINILIPSTDGYDKILASYCYNELYHLMYNPLFLQEKIIKGEDKENAYCYGWWE